MNGDASRSRLHSGCCGTCVWLMSYADQMFEGKEDLRRKVNNVISQAKDAQMT